MGVFLLLLSGSMFYLAYVLRRNKLNKLQEEKNRNYEINERRSSIFNDFKVSVKKSIGDYTFMISDDNKKLGIKCNSIFKTDKPILTDISKLTGYEIIQDDIIVGSGNLGGAILGGFIAGGAGAVVGSNVAGGNAQPKTIGIKFMTNDIHNPVLRVEIYDWLEKYKREKFVEKYSAKDIRNQLEDFIEVLNIVKAN